MLFEMTIASVLPLLAAVDATEKKAQDISLLFQVAHLLVTVIIGYFVARTRSLEADLKKALGETLDARLAGVTQNQIRHDADIAALERSMALQQQDNNALRVEVIKSISDLEKKVVTTGDLKTVMRELKNETR